MWSLRYEWIKAVWHGLWASLLLLATVCSCNTWQNINPWPFIFVVICASPPIYIITGAVILELSFYTSHVTLLSLLHECGHKAASSAWDFCEQQPILMCCSLLSQWRGRSLGNSCAGELQGGNNIFSVHEKQWCTPHWLAANIFLHVLNLLFWVSSIFFNYTQVDSGIFTYMAAQTCVHQGKSPCSVVLSTRGWEFGLGCGRAGQSNGIFVSQILLCGGSCCCDPVGKAV